MAKLRHILAFLRFDPYRRIPEYRGVLKLHITPLRVVNYYFAKLAMHFGWESLRNAPWGLDVEPAMGCNLQCPLCPVTTENRPKQKLDYDHFVQFVAPITKYLFMIDFSHWGEPLLNPELGKMIRFAKKHKIATIVRSNFNVLTDSMAQELVESGCDLLLIGMDSADAEAYKKYRVGGDLQKLENNLEKIQEWKTKLHSKSPILFFYGLSTSYSRDLSGLKSLANQYGVEGIHMSPIVLDFFLQKEESVFEIERFKKGLKTFTVPSEGDSLYYKEENSTVKRRNQQKSCWMAYGYPALCSTGRLQSCWHIFHETDALTDDLTLGFWNVWNGKKAQQIRHYLRTREKNPALPVPCERCSKISPSLN